MHSGVVNLVAASLIVRYTLSSAWRRTLPKREVGGKVMPKVLLTEPIPRPLAQRLQAVFSTGVDFDVVPTLEEADFATHAADADVLLVVHRKIDASTLALAPRVRFVQRAGIGYDNLDVAAL